MGIVITWWMYILIVLFVFVTIQVLNYILKKYLEIRLDRRLAQLQRRNPAGQVTQIQGPPLGAEGMSYPLEDVRTPAVLEIPKHDKVKQSVLPKSEVENINVKPIGLESNYSVHRGEVPTNDDIERENAHILNNVPVQPAANSDDSKSQTVETRVVETLESKNLGEKSVVIILNEVQN